MRPWCKAPCAGSATARATARTRRLLAVCSGMAHLTLLAQQPPQIAYVYPAGGQTGTTVELEIGGQHLELASNVFCSCTGLQAVVLQHGQQPTQRDAPDLRDRRKMLNQQEKKTPEALQEIAAIDQKLARIEKRRLNPAIAETVPVQVTIAPQATPGNYELRLATPAGLSNPRIFQIGEQPEFCKSDNNASNTPAIAPRRDRKLIGGPPAAPPMAVTLPVTVNGWIPPGGADRFRFHACAGQQLVILTSARELIPYLADAVPGWFQAAVTLYDAQGHDLAYDDHYRFRPDPVLCCTVPEDGEYVLEIRDALYRGREDFVYRIAVGELPFVTDIFPLGAPAGTPTPIMLHGWNLSTNRVMLQAGEPGIVPFFTRSAGRTSNHVPVAIDALPECNEQEPNDSPANANPVVPPIIINGRIDTPGDVDVFRFEGHANDRIVAEVYARRLDSPLDSVLRLSDASGCQLAFNDDHEDKGSGLITHHADSYLAATLPADGTYFLQLWDAQHKGGAAYGYRLHLRAPQPDFALRVVPSSISIRSGATAPLTVYALRRDGFAGEIALTLPDAPAGFKLSTSRIATNQDLLKITLSAPATPADAPITLHLSGMATIAGQKVSRPAIPADDMMQAFAYRHLVPSGDLKVLVTRRPPPGDEARILSATPVRIPAGGGAQVQVRLPASLRATPVEFQLSDPPEGLTLTNSAGIKDAVELALQTDADKLTPGQKGSMVVKIFRTQTPPPQAPASTNKVGRVQLGTLPSIPFEIVKP